jgi:hypothetical protein
MITKRVRYVIGVGIVGEPSHLFLFLIDIDHQEMGSVGLIELLNMDVLVLFLFDDDLFNEIVNGIGDDPYSDGAQCYDNLGQEWVVVGAAGWCQGSGGDRVRFVAGIPGGGKFGGADANIGR